MRRFRWSKSNDVFLPEIDGEHQEIYRDVDELQKALASHAPLFQIHKILHRLIACTEDHFAHEERLMSDRHYESFAWHKQQHDTARLRMKQYAPRIEEGDAEAGRSLVEFLCKWLRDHTSLTDRMMGAFLRNQQREGSTRASNS